MGKSRKSRSNSRSYSRSPSRGYKKDRHFHSRAVKIFYEHSSREDSPSRRERERTRSRSSSKHRRYDRSGTKTKRRDSRSRSSSRGKRVIFDFEVFVESQYIKRLTENNEYIIKRIKNDIGIYRIDFDHELSIPGLDGSVIKLSDDSYTRKSDALLSILKEIQYQKGNDRGSRRDYHEHTVTILVPEGMVSLLIGSKGKQINNIMRESRAHVIVNPAIHKMTYRTVKIDGKPEYIASACKIIYKTLEKVSPNVEKIEKTPQPLELHKTRITAKLVFPKNSVGFIIGKEGSWIKDLCDKCLVSIKFQQDDSIRCVKDEEAICIIKGKLSGVINAIVIILRRAHEYENISKHYASDVIKLLIPNNFVNKLIGAKGCMIREIAAKSGGAQIKIMSDKQTEKEYQDCVVAIAGSLANKQDAVCYILEQIEIFKNGGPILVNGKAINDNLAQQFRHSIPPRDSTGNQRRSSIDELNEPYIKEEENATDEEYYSRGTQDAKRRSRSRSVHSLQENDLNKPASNRKMSEEVGVNIYEAYPSTHQDNINVKVENEIVTKQEQVVLTDPRTEIYKKLDHSSEKRNSHSPTNEKLSPNRNSAKHNFRRRNSRSKSNSYSRSRSRSKSLSVRELANKISRSPSISKVTSNYNKSHYNRDECDKYHKDSPRSKQLAHGSERKDVTKNSHYVDSKGDMRITTTVIVPNYLVPYLIGKNGEVIKNIETKTTAKISFQRENKTNDSIPVNTAEGIRGRIVSIAGPLSSMIEAFGLLTDEIIKLEKSINGTRYEKS